MQSSPKDILKKYFGYDQFRPLQKKIIDTVYEGKDALVLMPTGGGKSICYQIPSIGLPGTGIVVSPLISLMKNQVDGLLANGVKAAYLNSSLSMPEQRSVEDDFFNGNLDLLYVSPEKMISADMNNLLSNVKINLFAIDEAHCISSWGHDFRPDYTMLSFIKKRFPQIPVLALTATADKITRNDIIKLLAIPDAAQFIDSFDRPNIRLEVRPGQRRREQIIQFIKERPSESGILYCLSRKSTEELANKLRQSGINAAPYHAGLSAAERTRVQEEFIKDEIPVICATIAFGMGIDKSNVRWVIHYNMPKNIEGYYQEIGRSGRDGTDARALLFYSYSDVMMLQDIITQNGSENEDIQLSKLDRMRQYAEAQACRRRILLNYFNESLTTDCGNCDVCENPPQRIDGTEIVQKALSAVYRLKESVGMGMLIDVLRGSGKKEIFQKGFNQIKTYGAGREIPYPQWQNFLLQILNLGFIEIAADQNNVVKLTPSSHKVLFDGEKVELVHLQTIKKMQEDQKRQAKEPTKRQRARNELFEVLRLLRRDIALKKGLPPYLVFTDATLEEMAATYPVNTMQMEQISGVGEQKLNLYGDIFLDAIRDFINQNATSFTGSTTLLTLELFNQGHDIAYIAEKRGLSEATIENHLSKIIEEGEAIDTSRLITAKEIDRVKKAKTYVEDPGLKPIYEYLEEQINYSKIKIALAILARES
ncbi:MAG: DNA helicase RecQ [Saprospiraceae bacterium]|nr:DNA helicase RecQ [Saprospiraceae bacterium]MCB9323313.1 DNA helicase RecQ [Lewinellaceae bacterium]